jgi:hypothetical protein
MGLGLGRTLDRCHHDFSQFHPLLLTKCNVCLHGVNVEPIFLLIWSTSSKKWVETSTQTLPDGRVWTLRVYVNSWPIRWLYAMNDYLLGIKLHRSKVPKYTPKGPTRMKKLTSEVIQCENVKLNLDPNLRSRVTTPTLQKLMQNATNSLVHFEI